MKRAILISLLLPLLLASFATGRTISVDDDGLADFNNIQEAIEDANDGDTVLVADGLYRGEGNRDIDFKGKAITVKSENGPENCIIDCNGTETEPHRGFYFHTSEEANSVLDGFTITGGTAGRGGAIFGSGTTATTITRCIIKNNLAFGGGGGLSDCRGTITNCVVVNNTANLMGGGLSFCSGTITNCVVVNNTANYGGGLSGCSGTISNCIIATNVATEDGGGLYSCDGSITNCTIVDNTTTIQGGGMFQYNGSITNCIIWGNGPDQFFNCSEPKYSCVEDGSAGEGSIEADPMFASTNNGDYHLLPGSRCIDTGDPNFVAGANSVDIDGQPRVLGSRVDMGADEFGHIVTKPKGGEVWASGSKHQVRWGGYTIEATVKVLFSKDGGGNWQTVESNLPDTGSYTWHLPDIVDSNQCLISVALNMPDSNVTSFNSGAFTIHPDSPGPVVVSKWKSLGGDFDRIGLSQNYGPETGCVKWKFELDGAVPGSVTVGADDRVHIASEDGKVYTLDANGVQLWSYDTNSPLLSSPTIGPDGTVYVGSQNGKLYAIDINGNLRWTHTTEGFIYSSPAVADDGKIYVGSQDGVLHALGQDGSELWTFKIGGFGIIEGAIFASPATGVDGTIYVGGLYDPNLYALDPNDGSVKWVCHFESGGWPFASPVVAADGTIYQTLLYDPNLYAIDRNDGNIIWSAHLSKINVWDEFTYSRWFEPYYYESGLCRHPFLPFMYWGAKYNVGDSGWSEPAVGPDGTIYVSLDDPYLRAVDPNGSIKWIRKPGARSGYIETCGPLGCGWYEKSPGVMSSFSLTVDSNGLIYAASNDSNLYVVNPEGFEIARFDGNDHWLSFPVISKDDTIMVSDSRDNSMLISHPNNVVWAIEGNCEGEELDLYWQSGVQDLDDNGVVDFNDLEILVVDWLKCTYCGNRACQPIEVMFLTGDINRDLYVNFADFALLAERWLSGN